MLEKKSPFFRSNLLWSHQTEILYSNIFAELRAVQSIYPLVNHWGGSIYAHIEALGWDHHDIVMKISLRQ